MPPLTAPKPDTYVETRVASLSSKETAPRETLAAVGDLVRRRARHPAMDEILSSALVALRSEEVVAALSELDPITCEESVARAAAEAFEAAFADSPEERELFAEAAVAGLLVRDRIESVVVAATRYAEACGADDVRAALGVLGPRFEEVDRALVRRHARSLTGINPERRACLEELDEEARPRAAWFAARVETDGLLEALAASPAPAGGTSAAVREDLTLSALPRFAAKTQGARRDFSDAESSALFHVALARASASEREFLGLRAEKDETLAVALRDLLEPDEAGG